MKRAESEAAATEWAIAEMRRLGLPIKRKVMGKYVAYIKNTLRRGLRRGGRLTSYGLTPLMVKIKKTI
jgi:hypothetical protein